MREKNKIKFQEMDEDLHTYFKWSANALMPVRGRACDLFLKQNLKVILPTAQRLLRLIGYTPGPIYRGVLLPEPVHALPPHQNIEYLSFSTDRSVAYHFANPYGFGSQYPGYNALLGSHGYVIEYTPQIAEVLFHYELLLMLPYAFAFSMTGINGELHVAFLSKQKEVTILQPAEALTHLTKMEVD